MFNLSDNSRNIYLFDAIYTWSSQSVIKEMINLNKKNNEPINLIINSIGGVVSDALAIIDVMNAIECEVNTITLGEASSAGSLIASAGKKRYISENSQMMIHEAAIQGYGFIDTRDSKMDKTMQRIKSLNEKLALIYAKNTGQPFSKVAEMLGSKEDIYFSARESVDFGLADAILTNEEMKAIKLSEAFSNINLSQDLEVKKSKEVLKKVHLLKACELKDRNISIDEKTLLTLKNNFDNNIRGQEISIDYTHDNDNGEKKAGAWIKELIVENDNLFAMVEFTPTAEKMLKDKEYKYLSVEIDPFYSNEEGKLFNNVLLGATFTNRPAVKGLEPIKLSENINKNKIKMDFSKEEITSIEAFKAMNIEIKDIHNQFVSMQKNIETLSQEKSKFEAKAKELEAEAQEAKATIAKIENEKIENDKIIAFDNLVAKGIVAPAQKEKVLAKFSSKSEIEDFYKDVPASISVKAQGSDVVDGSIAEEDKKLRELAKQTGQSIEDIRKYGLKK